MKIKLLIASLFLVQSYASMAQSYEGVNVIAKTIRDSLFNNLQNDGLKDSIAIYTSAIKLKIVKKGLKAFAEKISVSDSIAYTVFYNLDFLKKINYAPLMKSGDTITVIVPVAIMMNGCNTCPPGQMQLLSRSDFTKKILKLFYEPVDYKASTTNGLFLRPAVFILNNREDY